MLSVNLPICYACRRGEGLPECNGPCLCPVDDKSVVAHAEASRCPKLLFGSPPPRPNAAGRRPRGTGAAAASRAVAAQTPVGATAFERAATGCQSMQKRGPGLWAELHTNLELDLEAFAGRIPCGSCRAHWIEVLATDPPEHGPERFGRGRFPWGVRAHNAINRRLDKPEFTLEEARALWPQPSAFA